MWGVDFTDEIICKVFENLTNRNAVPYGKSEINMAVRSSTVNIVQPKYISHHQDCS